jgi:hypothetical protein
MQTNTYQICFRSQDQSEFQSTGVTAQFHKSITGISVDDGNETTAGELTLGRDNIFSVSWKSALGSFTLASLIMSRKSCASEIDNPVGNALGASGHLNISNAGKVLVGENILSSSTPTLPPLTYHLCAMSANGVWVATGLSLTTRHSCASSTELASDVTTQSNTNQGALNIVRFLINVEDIPVSDSVLYLSGLTGSLTADSHKFLVEGNSFIENTFEKRCNGDEPQPSCTVIISDYLKSGHQISGVKISMFAKCTNFDGLEKTIQISIGSGPSTPVLNLQRGPWYECINACEKEVSVLNLEDVTRFTDSQGTPISIDVSASPTMSYFDCSGSILQVRVVVAIIYLELGSSILYGSWTQESGTMALPKIDTIVVGPTIAPARPELPGTAGPRQCPGLTVTPRERRSLSSSSGRYAAHAVTRLPG